MCNYSEPKTSVKAQNRHIFLTDMRNDIYIMWSLNKTMEIQEHNKWSMIQDQNQMKVIHVETVTYRFIFFL